MNNKSSKQATQMPTTHTIAYMATELWAGIIASIGEENQLSEEWIQWAGRNYFSNQGTALRENPKQEVVIEWPTIPLGRDNDSIHEIWDSAKEAYAASVRAEGQMQRTKRIEAEILDGRPRYKDGDYLPTDWRDAREVKAHWQRIQIWRRLLK